MNRNVGNGPGQLILVLTKAADFLSDRFGDDYSFYRQSGSQATAQLDHVAKYGVVTSAGAYTALLASSSNVRQLEAALFVASVVVRRAQSLATKCLNERDVLGFLWQLRAIIERYAHIHYLVAEIEKISPALSRESGAAEYLKTFDYDQVISRALYGTTIKWNELSLQPLESPRIPELVGKKASKTLGHLGAKQILDKIDSLNDAVKGTRAAYEILCEYLHPNVGDYYACTSSYAETTERYGAKIIRRNLSLAGLPDVPTADRVVVDKVCKKAEDLTDQFLADIHRAIEFKIELEKRLREYTRSVVRNNRKAFRRADLCPCCSGASIGSCCGKGLNLDV